MNYVRSGKALISEGANSFSGLSSVFAEEWIGEVTRFLSKHVSREATERFITAEEGGDPSDQVFARVQVLEEIAKDL